jgi:hypothetical protein
MRQSTRTCYRCGEPATSKEHFPPKAFFPKGGNLQLKTVPSCVVHNNDKSADDQYLLTQICLNAAVGDNLASQIFRRSILPALQRSPGFRALMNAGAEWVGGGARRYPVNIDRFDNFFDGLVHAIFFDRYGFPLPSDTHRMSHIYVNLISEDPVHLMQVAHAKQMTSTFVADYADMVSRFEAAKVDEVVYGNAIIDPGGPDASITIAHDFYGVFQVVSMLTRVPPMLSRPGLLRAE